MEIAVRTVIEVQEYIGLGAVVAGGVLVGLVAAYAVFAAVAWMQNWWKYR